MAGFVQIIEFDTSRVDELKALSEEMRADRQGGASVRGTITADRDRPGHYITIAEFDSYDEAMRNSNDPQTQEFAARMAELCDGPPRFHNLGVVETWQT